MSIFAAAVLLSGGVVQADLAALTVVDGLAAARCCREQCHHSTPAHCKRDCCTIGAPQPDANAVLSKKSAPVGSPLQGAAHLAGVDPPWRVAARLGSELESPPSPIPIYLLRCVLRI